VTLLALLPTYEPVPTTTSALDPGHQQENAAGEALQQRGPRIVLQFQPVIAQLHAVLADDGVVVELPISERWVQEARHDKYQREHDGCQAECGSSQRAEGHQCRSDWSVEDTALVAVALGPLVTTTWWVIVDESPSESEVSHRADARRHRALRVGRWADHDVAVPGEETGLGAVLLRRSKRGQLLRSNDTTAQVWRSSTRGRRSKSAICCEDCDAIRSTLVGLHRWLVPGNTPARSAWSHTE
jgi:hypothetical protein